jgi:hypothetical protein
VVEDMNLEELEAVLEKVRERREAGEEVDEEAEGIKRFNPKTRL